MVVNGRSIGTVELVSMRGTAPDTRVRTLAQAMAGEAAMALENARLYEELRHQAFHDGLTGLANRVLLRDRLEHALARRERVSDTWLAILFLDLDDFKMVNDRLGHDVGDRILCAVAERLQACLRPGDTVARLGGDEFAILIEDVVDLAEAEAVAARLVAALAEPIEVRGEALVAVGASIGVVLTGREPATVDDLLRHADLAMYRAKNAGKGRYQVYRFEAREARERRATAIAPSDPG
jgi:diguanylate cyclase (GGDEF)-like protein